MISGEITMARLLDEHHELAEVLASYHPHFEQYRDPRRRRLMAARLTLDQAARIAGVPTDDLLAALRRATREAPPRAPEGREADAASPVQTESRGEAASRPDVPAARQVHLDVRDDIHRGEEPFARIMAAVKGLGPGEALVLRVPFEPIPLYDALGKRGLAHWAERRGPDDWSVWFHRLGAGEPDVRTGPPPPVRERRFTIDVRGLEPPQPMVRILEAVERLRPGDALEVLHERRPMFLYPQLDERGFLHETDERTPGLVRIVIRAGEGAT